MQRAGGMPYRVAVPIGSEEDDGWDACGSERCLG
jgi:hypothetical protein